MVSVLKSEAGGWGREGGDTGEAVSDTGVDNTDGGDVDGWVHRRYSTERDLKGTRTV